MSEVRGLVAYFWGEEECIVVHCEIQMYNKARFQAVPPIASHMVKTERYLFPSTLIPLSPM